MILISACLIGQNVKYDGTNNIHPVAKKLYESGEAIPVCPEVLGGLATPRIPSEIIGQAVRSKDGHDVTGCFLRGAQKALNVAKKQNIRIAVLQERSPSCGVHQVYDGSFTGRLMSGQGVTTSLLAQHRIRVMTMDEYLREHHETDQ